VLDVDRLVNNLCTMWGGRHKLQANILRFQREPLKRHSSLHNIDGVKRGNSGDSYNSNGVKGAANSYARIVNGSQKFKDGFGFEPSDANLKVVVANEGFDNIKFKYIGGYWLMMEFQTEVTKLKFQENSVMKTWLSQIQLASSDFNADGRVTWVKIKGKVFWVSAKEVPGWIPDFVEDNDEEEDSEVGHFKKSEVSKSGGSILQLIDDLVKVGEPMRYDMKGCMKNMEEIIELQRANDGHR
nr:hypothetical protein [Tanacetum cinerariifolium]